MTDRNCEINREGIENDITNMQSIIDYVVELMKIFYNILSGKMLADLIKEKLGKN